MPQRFLHLRAWPYAGPCIRFQNTDLKLVMICSLVSGVSAAAPGRQKMMAI